MSITETQNFLGMSKHDSKYKESRQFWLYSAKKNSFSEKETFFTDILNRGRDSCLNQSEANQKLI